MSFVGAVTLTNIRNCTEFGASLFCGATAFYFQRQVALSEEPPLEAVKQNVTIGEVSDVFRQVWGESHDPADL